MMSSAPIFRFFLLGVLAGLPVCASAENCLPLESFEREVQAIFDKSRDAIVKVHAERQLAFGSIELLPNHRVGTGFFISADGLLLTAATVVTDADTWWIEWRDQKLPARLIGLCQRANVAVLKVESVETPILPFDTKQDIRVGSLALAIGFPYDLPSVPVVGFVNGLDIRRGTHVFPTSHIRASCKLSPGQGGGPLFNARGEVVGIVVAAHMDDQCYALPIAAAQRVCADILNRGRPQHGWAGLEVTEKQLLLTNPVAQTVTSTVRVLVRQVIRDTPAAAAGFQEQDVITHVGTNTVTGLADVLDQMFRCHSGDRVKFTLFRFGTETNITLTVGNRPDAMSPSRKSGLVPASQTRDP